MSIFNDKSLKGVAAAVSKIMDEELKGNQHKIDANKNGKIDSHDFKLLRAKKTMKEEEQLDELSKATVKSYVMKKMEKPTTTKKDVKGMTNAYNRLKNYKPTSEEVELDEAFPTVDDAKKRMNAGKTATGSVTKTKTGLTHNRDYKDDDTDDADDTQKKSKGYGARQNASDRGKSTGAKEPKKGEKLADTGVRQKPGRVIKTKTGLIHKMNESKLSFTEMLELYNEAGVEVINKIAPQTVKFGDTEVELIDANIVNGAVGITVAEEVDNETFTKEVEAQKAKNAGGGKKAEVAKASVQAVKQEEVELDEAKKMEYDQKKVYHLQYVVGVLEDAKKQFTKLKDTAEVIAVIDKAINVVAKEYTKHLNALSAGRGQDDNFKVAEMISKLKFKKSKKTNEEVEQIDELSKNTLTGYIKKAHKVQINDYQDAGDLGHSPERRQGLGRTEKIHRAVDKLAAKKTNEEVEQIDELSKGTLGSYIKKASHDVAAKGAFTRHFADKSRAETAEQKHDIARKTMKKADKMQDAGMKRRANMAKAVDRLTKEETQLDEKLPASASAGDYIHDFVHSDNPKFAGKSTKERQKMALGAFYAKNKGK